MSDISSKLMQTVFIGNSQCYLLDIIDPNQQSTFAGLNPQADSTVLNYISFDESTKNVTANIFAPQASVSSFFQLPIGCINKNFPQNLFYVYSFNSGSVPVTDILADSTINQFANPKNIGDLVTKIEYDIFSSNCVVYTTDNSTGQNYRTNVGNLDSFKEGISNTFKSDYAHISGIQKEQAAQSQPQQPVAPDSQPSIVPNPQSSAPDSQPSIVPNPQPLALNQQPQRKFRLYDSGFELIRFAEVFNKSSNSQSFMVDGGNDISNYNICSISIDKDKKNVTFILANQSANDKNTIYTSKEVPFAALKHDAFENSILCAAFDSNLKISDVLHSDAINATHLNGSRILNSNSKVESINLYPFVNTAFLVGGDDSILLDSGAKDSQIEMRYDGNTFIKENGKLILSVSNDLLGFSQIIQNEQSQPQQPSVDSYNFKSIVIYDLENEKIKFGEIFNQSSNLLSSFANGSNSDILNSNIGSFTIKPDDKIVTFNFVGKDGKPLGTKEDVPFDDLKPEIFNGCHIYAEFSDDLEIGDLLLPDVIAKNHIDTQFGCIQKITNSNSKINSILLSPFTNEILLNTKEKSIGYTDSEGKNPDNVDTISIKYDEKTFTERGEKTFIPLHDIFTGFSVATKKEPEPAVDNSQTKQPDLTKDDNSQKPADPDTTLLAGGQPDNSQTQQSDITNFLGNQRIIKIEDNRELTLGDLMSEEAKKTSNNDEKRLQSLPISEISSISTGGHLLCANVIDGNQIVKVNVAFGALKQNSTTEKGAKEILLNSATVYFPKQQIDGFYGSVDNAKGNLEAVIFSSLPGNDNVTAHLKSKPTLDVADVRSNVLYSVLQPDEKQYYAPLMQKQIDFINDVKQTDFSLQQTQLRSKSNMKAKIGFDKQIGDDLDITADIELSELQNEDEDEYDLDDIKTNIIVSQKTKQQIGQQPKPIITGQINVKYQGDQEPPQIYKKHGQNSKNQYNPQYNQKNSQYNNDDQSDKYGNPRPLFQRHYKTPNHLVEPRYHPSSDETETLQYPSHRSRIRYEDGEYPTYHTTMPLHHKRLVSPFYDYDPAIMNPFGYNPGLFAYDMGFADGMRYAPQPNMQGMGMGMGMGGGMGFGGIYGGGFLVGHPFLMSPFGYHAMPGVDYSQPPKFMGGFGAFGGGMGMGMGMGGFGGFHQPANNMYASPFFAPQLPYSPFANPLDFQLFQEFQQFKQHPQFPPYPPIPPMINEEEIQRFQIAQQLSQQKLMEEFPWAKPFIAPAYPIEFAPRMELPLRERPELPQQKPAAIPSTHQQKLAQKQEQQSQSISQTI
ncbi:MAG: hypothetical protein Ta2D_01610 [Rickettsiales bacterium]|nr:MAG: hypothetical protein Ta2D_01610 [Rickettsiales bacterium]